jgi:ribose transport system permease protein
MQSISGIGILAVGITCLFIGGGIDLSGTNLGLFAGVVIALLINAGLHWFPAAIIVIVIGAIIGSINAFMIAKLGMMPFIATIALSNVLLGVNMAITKGQNVPVPHKEFWWGGNSVFDAIPIPFIILVVLLVAYGLMLTKTQFGRNIYLVGGNQAAARLTGVNPVKTRSILYINNGRMSALAGIVMTSRMQTAAPQSQSDNQMTAITAAILGGVAFTGGVGGMPGCFIGIIILGFFNAGLTSLALDSYWQAIASGLLLIIAMAVDFVNERSRDMALKGKSRAALRAKKEGGL